MSETENKMNKKKLIIKIDDLKYESSDSFYSPLVLGIYTEYTNVGFKEAKTRIKKLLEKEINNKELIKKIDNLRCKTWSLSDVRTEYIKTGFDQARDKIKGMI